MRNSDSVQTIPNWLHKTGLSTLAILISAAVLSWSSTLDQDDRTPSYRDHERLMYYLDSQGKEHPVKNNADWEIRRGHLLAGFQQAVGTLPSRNTLPDLEIRVKEIEPRDKHIRQTIDFVSEEGDRTPCYLYIPKNIQLGEQRPGIVALHPTHQIGKGVLDVPTEPYTEAYARELADRGYVVIAPDYMPFGDYAGYDFSSDRYSSGTMKGIWNHMRCVDLLSERPDVDPQKIGAIGHSLGGHNAIFLGAMDRRVRVIVSSCGWTPFHDYYEGNIEGWSSDRYIPSLSLQYHLDPDQVPFDFYELLGALAPRPFFSSSPLGDSNFDYRGVEKAAPEVRKVYTLYGESDQLRIIYPDVDHSFPKLVREEAYRFLDQYLKLDNRD